MSSHSTHNLILLWTADARNNTGKGQKGKWKWLLDKLEDTSNDVSAPSVKKNKTEPTASPSKEDIEPDSHKTKVDEIVKPQHGKNVKLTNPS